MAEEGEFLISNVLLPTEVEGKNGYGRFDVLLSGGLIARVKPSPELSSLPEAKTATWQVVDGSTMMLVPGSVNAHTHSIEQWARGAIGPLPLELWVDALYHKCDPRRDPDCPTHTVYLSALHMGLETIMTGGTAIMDHLFCRHIGDVEAAVEGYKKCGIRAFIAPMLADLDRTNYYPLVTNAKELNEEARERGETLGGLAPNGELREEFPPRDAENTKKVMDLWRESVEKFHDPENGINIAIGPMQNWSCSDELIEESVELRKKYNLCGHIHLLETRQQVVLNRQKYGPGGGAVRKLQQLGWLGLPGTSCAHCVWLNEEEQKIMAECGAVAVHNPASNIRLGSGIAPLREYLRSGMTVAIGCDGSCSNDGQDMLEAIKLSCILNPLTSPEYRDWLSPREVLKMATEGGAAAIGMRGRGGEIKEGYVADVALYDLTSLSMLPRTDPVGLLVLGRPSSGVGGNALHSVWVRGRRVLKDGVPQGVDLTEFRKELIETQPDYLDLEEMNPTGTDGEVEFRAAMGLEGKKYLKEDKFLYSNFPKYRVNYDAEILPSDN